MDVNQVLEVPDTPDRLAAAHNGDHNNTDKRSDSSMNNNRIASSDYINLRMRNEARGKGKSVAVNGNQRLFIRPDSCSNSPTSRSGDSCSFKNARPTTMDAIRHDKGKALCNSDVQNSTCKKSGSFAGLTEKNGHGGNSGVSRVNASRKGVLPLNGFSAVNSLDRSSKSSKVNNTLETGPSSGSGKDHKAESNASACMQPCTTSKAPRQKMLVRNGCISPYNIAKSKHVAEKHETGSVVKEAQNGTSGTSASDVRSSGVVDIKDLIAEAKDSQRCKGKRVFCHPSSEEPAAGSGNLSHRRPIPIAPVDSSSGFSVGASRCSTESERWRTTHNHRKHIEIEHQKKGTMQRNHINGRDVINLDDSEVVVVSSPRVRDPPPETNETIPAHQLDTAERNLGKRAVSFWEPSTSRPKRNKSVGTSSNSVSEPDARHGNGEEDSNVRALQVEADEMLARELQEQLYNEPAPAVDTHEMDSPSLPFAIPVQQDNRSRHGGRRASAIRSQESPVMNVDGRIRRRPTLRRRLQNQVRTSTRTNPVPRLFSRSRTISSSSNRRNSVFPPNMDLDMRMQILETLETVGDMRRPNNLLQVGREFNEGDYEMLLALDDDNHRHGGATRAQINNLPESTVQAENLQECSICLETPTIGETIRHLPCLHRFHKACIDPWLRRKTSCPVCKSSVT